MSTGNKNWKQLENNIDKELMYMIENSDIPKIRSQNPLISIKRNLLINMIWGLIICCVYIVILFCFAYTEVRLCLGLVMLFSLWALLTSFMQYRKMEIRILANQPLLDELKRQRSSIVNWMQSQSRIALFIYPVSAAGGFMLGGAIGSGKPVAVFMGKPLVWLLFVIVVAILVPLCNQLAKWMYKRSFGIHLDELQKHIEELETEK